MPAPPAKAEISAPFPAPSNSVARTGFGKLWETLFGTTGLLGTSGNAIDARAALGLGSAGSAGSRNRVRNPVFMVNQRLLSGSVVLAAGVAGHYGWKAGAAGCSYTFTTNGNKTTLSIASGSLVQVVVGEDVERGDYCLSWTGTEQGKFVGGAYGASGVTLTGQAAGTNMSVEFGTGTLTEVMVEPGAKATSFERPSLVAEYLRCRRFYRRVGRGLQGICTNSTIARFKTELNPPMRTAPTISVTTASFSIEDWGQASYPTTTGALNVINSNNANLVDFNLQGGFTGVTATRQAYLTSDVIQLSAEP